MNLNNTITKTEQQMKEMYYHQNQDKYRSINHNGYMLYKQEILLATNLVD
jgi:hypothetical protein